MATLVANVVMSGTLTVSQTCYTPSLNTLSHPYFSVFSNAYIYTLAPVYVGIGLAPPITTIYQVDMFTDNARKLLTSTWTTGSDIRIKQNIETANLVRCAEILDTLDLKYFEWMYDTKDKHALGWIAQDVQSVFPNAVKSDPDTGILSLNSDQLIKVLFGALKQTRIEFFSGS